MNNSKKVELEKMKKKEIKTEKNGKHYIPCF